MPTCASSFARPRSNGESSHVSTTPSRETVREMLDDKIAGVAEKLNGSLSAYALDAMRLGEDALRDLAVLWAVGQPDLLFLVSTERSTKRPTLCSTR
jgi:hypothetical protein